MGRCKVVTLTVDGKTETIRAQVARDFGSDEDAAALADLVSAARRRWARASHPEPLTVPCPRCGAMAGVQCATATGRTALPWGHQERHAAAIEADGRTCADGGGL